VYVREEVSIIFKIRNAKYSSQCSRIIRRGRAGEQLTFQ
jgi:hypothetical protein